MEVGAEIVVDRVSHDFGGRPVLDSVSFRAAPHELLCIVGRSGCGKTTLLRIMAGLLEPRAGEVLVDGQPVSGPSPRTAMVFQHFGLFPWKSVRANIGYGLANRGRRDPQRVSALVRMIGLEDAADMRCANCVRGRYTSCLNYGRADKGHRAMGMSVDGGFADYVVNHVSTLYPLPDSIGFDEAVMITTAGTSMYAVDTMGGLVAGDTVAVIGPGPVGLTAVQILKSLGAARVLLVGTRLSRLRLGRELGADAIIEVRDGAGPAEAVLDATGSLGVDAVLECSGAAEMVDQALRMCRPAGRIVLVGYFHGPVTADLNRAVKTGLTLFTIRGEGNRAVGRAVTLAERGLLRTLPLITHRFPLEEIGEAFDTFAERRDDAVKVVLEIGETA